MTGALLYRYADPPPFAHQVATINRIIADRGVHALLHDPGTGKSRSVVDYTCFLATALEREIRVLILCPKDVRDTWLTQFRLFAPASVDIWIEQGHGRITEQAKRIRILGTGGPLDRKLTSRYRRTVRRPEAPSPDEQPQRARVVAFVTNIESFSVTLADKPHRTITLQDRMIQAVKDAHLDLLVLDESHRCKGPSANAARGIARAARWVPRRLLLTGTPMPHGPLDVWAQARILDPQMFSTDGDQWGYSRFAREYAVFGGWMGREVTGYQNLDDLEQRMVARSSVVRKADALDLPPTMDVIHEIDLTPRELTAYEEMRRDLVARLDSGDLTAADNRLVQLLRLRQISSGYLGISKTEHQELGPGKIDACVHLLEDLLASERRVVVFVWSRVEHERLVAKLRADPPFGTLVAEIHGGTRDSERVAIRAAFGSDDPHRIVLVAQIRTMSLGVNELVTASHAVFLSMSQLRDDFVQAKGRLDRPGQVNPVTYHFVIARDTIDAVIIRAHQERGDLEEMLLSHVREARR